MLYTFANQGEYELLVRFQNEGEKLVEASFPVSVQNSEAKEDLPQSGIVWFMGGLVVSAVIALFVGVIRRKK